MKRIFTYVIYPVWNCSFIKAYSFFTVLFFSIVRVHAQDPSLPPSNLGLANIYDGIAGKPGFVYVNYSQVYQTNQINNALGNNSHSDLKVNSLLSMHQFIYLTPVKILGGNLGFTVLVPVVKLSVTSKSGDAPSFNPSALGDVVIGTALQWSNKTLFNKSFSHRAEFDISSPSGSYDKDYTVNPSAHLFTISLYHALTFIMNEKISISGRNQLNYNTRIINTPVKPGAFYNGNYSLEYALDKKWHVEAIGYLLAQLTQDSYNGNYNYYKDNYDIPTTKQHVIGFGPGLAYSGNSGLLIEAKVFFETAAQNTTQGTRSTLRLAIPF